LFGMSLNFVSVIFFHLVFCANDIRFFSLSRVCFSLWMREIL
jgi:hypothetical protein